MEPERRWKYLICITATFTVFLAFFLQLLIVGLFFVLPYFSDCDSSPFDSPLVLGSCLTTNSTRFIFFPPPTCAGNDSLSLRYCSEGGCMASESRNNTSCSAPRCCCRSVPQTRQLTCMGNRSDALIDSECVYTTCESTLHSVLIQLYDSSDLSTVAPISGVNIQIGSNFIRVNDSNGTARVPDLPEGGYPVSVRSTSSNLISTEYFHASRLTIEFNSPPEIVFVIYVKRLNTTMSTNSNSPISNCSITNLDPIALTQFSTSTGDLLTLPHYTYSSNRTFIPRLVIFTARLQLSFSIDITCIDTPHYLFEYNFAEGVWSLRSGPSQMFLNLNGQNGVLWALATEISLPASIFYLNTVNSSLAIDRGAMAMVYMPNTLFASTIATFRSVVNISDIINNTDRLAIRYITSPYSQIYSSNRVVEGRSLSIDETLGNCADPHSPGELPSVTLSETNSLISTRYCYYPVTTNLTPSPRQSLLFSILVRSQNTDLSFSTLQTSELHACVRYPCSYANMCEISVSEGMMLREQCSNNCSSLGQLTVSECNARLQTLSSQNFAFNCTHII